MNIDTLPLFINVAYKKDGKEKTAHIQTRSLCGNEQDAQIGSFSSNWYIRPRGAVRCKKYKTLKSYKSACSRAMIAHGVADSVQYYYVDGKEWGHRVKI